MNIDSIIDNIMHRWRADIQSATKWEHMWNGIRHSHKVEVERLKKTIERLRKQIKKLKGVQGG